MKNGIVIAVGWVWACCGWAAEKPNLVIVHTDEHHFKTLGCYRALMAREQEGYIERTKEPHGEIPELRSVLNWAVSDQAVFVPPPQQAGGTPKAGKKKNKKTADEDE